MEIVRKFLSQVLTAEDANHLLPLLVKLGATSLSDLQFLDVEADLANVLPPIKRRKLAAALGNTACLSTVLFQNRVNICEPFPTFICERTNRFEKQNVSIMNALKNHPFKNILISEAEKPIMDKKIHRLLVKVACSHLIDCFGKYPPPEYQLAMAKSIVTTFKYRSCRGGNGYELYYSPGSSKGFLTNRFREIYRQYPAEQKKYRPRSNKMNKK
ncbi:uncharacterized protein LOC105849469 [Hydra vulgaris]|uniref:uncharacterized protein LOC105849469 n=1 Tax=Hydra vulgaris TaxID=6087 RepID=UPI000640BBAB|nr:uncharacterized protein LOC105849469 [Hydra vulgaris]XP_047133364.1 uncharacterized protein LOC105849469 [Hydra vulgaris]XP_047133365.1 uncharacterized protein LOC105849469 [Hydra vulgaris]